MYSHKLFCRKSEWEMFNMEKSNFVQRFQIQFVDLSWVGGDLDFIYNRFILLVKCSDTLSENICYCVRSSVSEMQGMLGIFVEIAGVFHLYILRVLFLLNNSSLVTKLTIKSCQSMATYTIISFKLARTLFVTFKDTVSQVSVICKHSHSW